MHSVGATGLGEDAAAAITDDFKGGREVAATEGIGAAGASVKAYIDFAGAEAVVYGVRAATLGKSAGAIIADRFSVG